MAKRGMNERIQRLREQSVTTPVHIDLERAKIETDFYKENDGKYSVPVMRAMTLKEYFSKKTLYFGDDELILGEKGKNPQASPTFPELCCHSEEDMKVMSERKLVSFHTTEEDRKLQAAEIIPFWKGRTIREKLLSRMTPEWHDCYEAGIFTEFMEQRGPGHTCGGEQVFTTGYLDYKEKIKKTMDALDWMNDPEASDKMEELKAMDICCDAKDTTRWLLRRLQRRPIQRERQSWSRLQRTWKLYRHTSHRLSGRQFSCTGSLTWQ